MTMMPTDNDYYPIPALRLKDAGAHDIAATTTSARNATAFNENTRVVSVYATVPVRLKMGNGTVTAIATDHYFPAGVYYDFSISGGKDNQNTHIAVLADDADGSVYISEKE